MYKTITKYGLVSLLLGYSVLALSHNGNNGFVSATNFTLWSNTYRSDVIRVFPSDGVYNPAECTDPDSYYVSKTIGSDAEQRIYSTLLAASFAGKSIELRVDPEICEGTKPAIVNVVLSP